MFSQVTSVSSHVSLVIESQQIRVHVEESVVVVHVQNDLVKAANHDTSRLTETCDFQSASILWFMSSFIHELRSTIEDNIIDAFIIDLCIFSV